MSGTCVWCSGTPSGCWAVEQKCCRVGTTRVGGRSTSSLSPRHIESGSSFSLRRKGWDETPLHRIPIFFVSYILSIKVFNFFFPTLPLGGRSGFQKPKRFLYDIFNPVICPVFVCKKGFLFFFRSNLKIATVV